MSEHYRNCTCNGICQRCGGTGFTGDAMDLVDTQFKLEWERDYMNFCDWGFRWNTDQIQKWEDESRAPNTPAMDKAISVVIQANERKGKRTYEI